MLYVTTRNNNDVFTAQHALAENRGADGGLYIPFANPAMQLFRTASIRTGGAWVPTLRLFCCHQKAFATRAATPFQRQRPQKV